MSVDSQTRTGPAPQTAASWRALGTSVRLAVTDAAALPLARRMLHLELCALDQACSRFREDSELAQVVDGARGLPVEVSPLLAEAITTALRAAELTDGQVDPTVGEAMRAIGYDRDFTLIGSLDMPVTIRPRPAPGWQRIEWDADTRRLRVPVGVHLDLGATAKALSSDRAVRAIHEELGCGVLVSLGGDLAVAGPTPDEGWQIRVQDVTGDPADQPTGPHATVVIRSGGIATSSTTARRWVRGGQAMHHIVDPRIGLPAVSPWRTVSVAADSCVDANIAATATIVRGAAAVSWLQSLGLPSRLVDNDGRVQTVAGWPTDDAAAA